MAVFYAVDCGASGFKGRAAQLIDGRTNAVGDSSNADSDAQRQRLEQNAESEKDTRDGFRLSSNRLELISRRNRVGKQDQLFAKVLLRGLGERMGKGMAQILLSLPVRIPKEMYDARRMPRPAAKT